MAEEKDFLTELDNAIADGDHGINMAKGFAATKGRASYIGERSIGHQDPGATSVALLLEVVANSL